MNSGQLLEGLQMVSYVHLCENRENVAIELFTPRPLTFCLPAFFLWTVLSSPALPVTVTLAIDCRE